MCVCVWKLVRHSTKARSRPDVCLFKIYKHTYTHTRSGTRTHTLPSQVRGVRARAGRSRADCGPGQTSPSTGRCRRDYYGQGVNTTGRPNAFEFESWLPPAKLIKIWNHQDNQSPRKVAPSFGRCIVRAYSNALKKGNSSRHFGFSRRFGAVRTARPGAFCRRRVVGAAARTCDLAKNLRAISFFTSPVGWRVASK